MPSHTTDAIVKHKKASSKITLKERIAKAPTLVKVGVGVGTTALLIIGAPALIPVGIGSAGLAVYYKIKKEREKKQKYSSCMTPERIKIYEKAISTLKDGRKLRVLADEFEKQGCKKEADHLRKRAALREKPTEEKQAMRKAFKRGMKSTDIAEIEALADKLEKSGADAAVKELRIRCEALKALSKAA